MDQIHYSSDSEHWNTPESLLERVYFLSSMIGADADQVALDPCSNLSSRVKARERWCLSPIVTRLQQEIWVREKAGADAASVRATLERVLADPTKTRNGLRDPWRCLYGLERPHNGLVFVNPPYGRALSFWAAKIAKEADLGVAILALVPARTDTAWFHALASAGKRRAQDVARVCFLRGRVRFSLPGKEAASSAPFPSALFFYGQHTLPLRKAFGDAGLIVAL